MASSNDISDERLSRHTSCVDKQQVFEDDEDYIRFLNVLRRQTQPDVDVQGQTFQPRCHVYAYCLMGNYVHLLLKEGSSQVSQAFHTP